MMTLRTKIVALPLAALAVCTALQFHRVEAASVVLTPTIDVDTNKLAFTDGPGLKIGYHFGEPGGDSRAVVVFDLSSVTGTVTGASLKLTQTHGGGESPLHFGNANLRKTGTPISLGDTPTQIWDAVGDANSTSLASFSFSGQDDGLYVLSNAAILATVQGWQSNPATNYGFGLKQAAETFTVTDRIFASAEAASGMPTLTVEFIPEPASAILVMVAAGGVAMLRGRRSY